MTVLEGIGYPLTDWSIEMKPVQPQEMLLYIANDPGIGDCQTRFARAMAQQQGILSVTWPEPSVNLSVVKFDQSIIDADQIYGLANSLGFETEDIHHMPASVRP